MTALRARRTATSPAVRLRRWRADPAYVHLSLPARRLHTLGDDELRRHLDDIHADGARGVVTSALCVADQVVFVEAGFAVIERLHLLRRSFDGAPPRLGRWRTRRGWIRDRPAILDVDHAAFAPFWQLDGSLLADALAATPRTRLRVAWAPGNNRQLVGYAIAGRTQARGYIQRLAVHPEHQGYGFGAALLADGLRWLSRGRVRDAVVNTQMDNARSLALYESMGFERQRHGLAVLRLDFGSETFDPR